jgi:hypothetical protein
LPERRGDGLRKLADLAFHRISNLHRHQIRARVTLPAAATGDLTGGRCPDHHRSAWEHYAWPTRVAPAASSVARVQALLSGVGTLVVGAGTPPNRRATWRCEPCLVDCFEPALRARIGRRKAILFKGNGLTVGFAKMVTTAAPLLPKTRSKKSGMSESAADVRRAGVLPMHGELVVKGRFRSDLSKTGPMLLVVHMWSRFWIVRVGEERQGEWQEDPRRDVVRSTLTIISAKRFRDSPTTSGQDQSAHSSSRGSLLSALHAAFGGHTYSALRCS